MLSVDSSSSSPSTNPKAPAESASNPPVSPWENARDLPVTASQSTPVSASSLPDQTSMEVDSTGQQTTAADLNQTLANMKEVALLSLRSRRSPNNATNSASNATSSTTAPATQPDQPCPPHLSSTNSSDSIYSSEAGRIHELLQEQTRYTMNISALPDCYQSKFHEQMNLFGFANITFFLRSLARYGIDVSDDLRCLRLTSPEEALSRERQRWERLPFPFPATEPSDSKATTTDVRPVEAKPSRSVVRHCIFFNGRNGCSNLRCHFVHSCRRCSSPAHGEVQCRLTHKS